MGFKTVTVTPTLSTDAYADNDVLFNPVKVPDAVPFNGGSKLISVSILDKSENRTPMIILVMKGNTDIGTINDTVSISDANLLANGVLGKVSIAAAKYTVSNDVVNSTIAGSADLTDIGIVCTAATDTADIYIAAFVQGGTPTYAADSMTITLGFEM